MTLSQGSEPKLNHVSFPGHAKRQVQSVWPSRKVLHRLHQGVREEDQKQEQLSEHSGQGERHGQLHLTQQSGHRALWPVGCPQQRGHQRVPAGQVNCVVQPNHTSLKLEYYPGLEWEQRGDRHHPQQEVHGGLIEITAQTLEPPSQRQGDTPRRKWA